MSYNRSVIFNNTKNNWRPYLCKEKFVVTIIMTKKSLTVSKSTFCNTAYFCLQIVLSNSCKKHFDASRTATKGGILLSLLHFKLISTWADITPPSRKQIKKSTHLIKSQLQLQMLDNSYFYIYLTQKNYTETICRYLSVFFLSASQTNTTWGVGSESR